MASYYIAQYILYKIIVKVLSLRIKPMAKGIVRLEQMRFLGRCFILDNLILTWETCEWAQQSEHNALLMKLNFDKGCERMRWRFIINCGLVPKYANMFTCYYKMQIVNSILSLTYFLYNGLLGRVSLNHLFFMCLLHMPLTIYYRNLIKWT